MESSASRSGEGLQAPVLMQNLARRLDARGSLDGVLTDACSVLTEIPGISAAVVHRLPSIRWQLEDPSSTTDRRTWPGPAIGVSPCSAAEHRLLKEICSRLLLPIEHVGGDSTGQRETHEIDGRCATLIDIPGIGSLAIVGELEAHELEKIAEEASIHIGPTAHASLNGELLARMQDRYGNYRSLDRRIAKTLARVDNLEALGLAVNELAETLFTIEYTAMYFLDPGSGELRLADAKGLVDWEIEDAERTAWDRHPGHVVRTGEILHVHDTENDPELRTRTSKRLARIRSRCYIPVHLGEQIVGTLGLASTKLAAFDEHHVEGVRFIADLAGLTWARIREQEAKQRRDQLLQAGGACADLLVGSPHWQASVDSVLTLVRDAFAVEEVHLIDLESGEIAGSTSKEPQDHLHKGLIAQLREEDVALAEADADGIHRVVAARIHVTGILWGALVLKQSGINRAFDDVLKTALRGVANNLGSAIARDELQLELVQAHKMEAIGHLAGGIAHDFNNLLWPILAYSETLREKTDDDDDRAMLADINLAAERAASLVEQILFMSRRRIGADDPVLFEDVIREVADITTPTLPPGVRIQVDVAPDTGAVFADRTALHRLVLNLCSNARTAMQNRQGLLRIRARRAHDSERLDGDRDTLVLEVQDEGSGMTEDVRARLFEPYFTTQEVGRGTGLGLTIVHRVVSELDGHVEVESSLNEGSTFHVRLPRSEPALEMPPTSPEDPVPTGGERILLVDDDPAVLATATALLESLGYTVNPVGYPSEALTLLQQTDPDDPGFDLILTDLTMPKIDGLQLAREATFLHPGIPVIVVTGFGDECEKAMRAAPIAAFLHKPITRTDLGKAVRTAIDEHAKSHQ